MQGLVILLSWLKSRLKFQAIQRLCASKCCDMNELFASLFVHVHSIDSEALCPNPDIVGTMKAETNGAFRDKPYLFKTYLKVIYTN